MARHYSVLFVGLGKQGMEHLNALLAVLSEDSTVNLTILDVNPPVLPQYSKFAKVLFVQSIEDIDSNDSFDLAVIATPTSLHHALVDRLGNRCGLIMKEKPLALNATEWPLFQPLIAESKLLVAQQRFFDNRYLVLQKHLSSIPIKSAQIRLAITGSPSGWYATKEMGGGCLNGLGWHAIWLAIFLFGSPNLTTLEATQLSISFGAETEESFSAAAQFGSTDVSFSCETGASVKAEEIDIQLIDGNLKFAREYLRFQDSSSQHDLFNFKASNSHAYENQMRCALSQNRFLIRQLNKVNVEAGNLHLALTQKLELIHGLASYQEFSSLEGTYVEAA